MIRFAGLMQVVVLLGVTAGQATANPLPSWSDGESRDAIIGFVESVSDPTSDAFVQVEDRIAVFDNDGTALGRTAGLLSTHIRR